MRAWRPAYKCLYVIPEVHGNYISLEIILNRILPLRFSIGQEDKLIMLGDYIDGDEEGARVIDKLIDIKNKYTDSIVFIRGNHEEMMLKAIFGSENDFNSWIHAGGATTISSYLKMNKLEVSPFTIGKNRLKDLIPSYHIEFLKNLEFYHILDDYIFFHGSFNHEKSINENNEIPEFKDNFIFVGAHNYNGKKPFMYQKYMMLSAKDAPKNLYIFELNAMKAARIQKNKSRIYNYKFNCTE